MKALLRLSSQRHLSMSRYDLLAHGRRRFGDLARDPDQYGNVLTREFAGPVKAGHFFAAKLTGH